MTLTDLMPITRSVIIFPPSLVLSPVAVFHKPHPICYGNILMIAVQLMPSSLPDKSWGIT